MNPRKSLIIRTYETRQAITGQQATDRIEQMLKGGAQARVVIRTRAKISETAFKQLGFKIQRRKGGINNSSTVTLITEPGVTIKLTEIRTELDRILSAGGKGTEIQISDTKTQQRLGRSMEEKRARIAAASAKRKPGAIEPIRITHGDHVLPALEHVREQGGTGELVVEVAVSMSSLVFKQAGFLALKQEERIRARLAKTQPNVEMLRKLVAAIFGYGGTIRVESGKIAFKGEPLSGRAVIKNLKDRPRENAAPAPAFGLLRTGENAAQNASDAVKQIQEAASQSKNPILVIRAKTDLHPIQKQLEDDWTCLTGKREDVQDYYELTAIPKNRQQPISNESVFKKAIAQAIKGGGVVIIKTK